MSAPVQLPLDGLPFDPFELVKLPLLDRVALYKRLQLAPEQREAAEQATPLVVVKRYAKRYREAAHRA
jgi:hypothetical protein